jgi:hypothetical protein
MSHLPERLRLHLRVLPHLPGLPHIPGLPHLLHISRLYYATMRGIIGWVIKLLLVASTCYHFQIVMLTLSCGMFVNDIRWSSAETHTLRLQLVLAYLSQSYTQMLYTVLFLSKMFYATLESPPCVTYKRKRHHVIASIPTFPNLT